MSKVRSRAVLAILVALPLWAGAGSAGATDAPTVADVGAGIDYTMQAPATAVVPGGIGAANALDLLSRPIAQAGPSRPVPKALIPGLAVGLRGLRAPVAANGAGLVEFRSSDEWVSKSPSYKGPRPYVRFSEEERVFGLSFKIQPPPQVPEVASPSL